MADITRETYVSPDFNKDVLRSPDFTDPGWQVLVLDANSALKTETAVDGGTTWDLTVRAGSHATTLSWTDGRAFAATDDDYINWRVPSTLINTEKAMYLQAVFKHTATAADTGVDFTVIYSASAYDGAHWGNVPSAAAEPSLDSSITLTAHTCSATANTIEWTAVKAFSAGALPKAPFWLIGLKLDDSGEANADEIGIQALLIWYRPKWSYMDGGVG